MATNNPGAGAPPSVNPDLKAVHTQLVAIASELDSAVGEATTAAQVDAILGELSAVTARVVAVGRELFKMQTAAITDLSKDVIKAAAVAKKDIKQLDDIRTFIQGMTGFLSLVDQLIGQAKLIL
jgi:hypothetical protein